MPLLSLRLDFSSEAVLGGCIFYLSVMQCFYEVEFTENRYSLIKMLFLKGGRRPVLGQGFKSSPRLTIGNTYYFLICILQPTDFYYAVL